MSTSRSSFAYLLAVILIICAPAGKQAALAQHDKSCEAVPAIRPSPGPIRTPAGSTIFGPPPPQTVSLPSLWEPVRPLYPILNSPAILGLNTSPIIFDSPSHSLLQILTADHLTNPISIPTQPTSAQSISVFNTVVGQGAGTDSEVVIKVGMACGDEILEPPKVVSLTSFTAGGHNIPVKQFRGAPRSYYNNNIYIHHSNVATAQELDRLVEVNKSFIEALGPQLLGDPALRNARFITTAKSTSGEFVTIFEVKDGKFGGIAVKLDARTVRCESGDCTMVNLFNEAIGPWLQPVSGRGRLYMIGDDLDQIDPTEIARRFSCDVIRRSSRILKSIKDTESRLAQLQGRKLEAAKTVYINGVPRNEVEAVRVGYQRNEVRGLQRASTEIDNIAKQFFNRASLPTFLPQDLQRVLTSGDSDVVLIVAHSDKERIYLNGTPVSIDEIRGYPDRVTPSSRPRICVLLSCYGGDFRIEKGWWLTKRNIESLAEVLIRKGYFDKVVTPRGEITPDQVTPILRDYFSGRLIRDIAAEHYQQLLQIAEFHQR